MKDAMSDVSQCPHGGLMRVCRIEYESDVDMMDASMKNAMSDVSQCPHGGLMRVCRIEYAPRPMPARDGPR